jgi:hypothetical protein
MVNCKAVETFQRVCLHVPEIRFSMKRVKHSCFTFPSGCFYWIFGGCRKLGIVYQHSSAAGPKAEV